MSFESATWLIAYDVREPRRLRRVHAHVSTVAVALQYSVFAADLDHRRLAALKMELRRRAKADEDDVRLYNLPANVRGAWIGPLPADENISLVGSPAAELARRLRDHPLT